MATKFTVQPLTGEKTARHQRRGLTRRASWLAVFAVSALFWVGVAGLIFS
ncbi:MULTISPECIES: YmiA family putative membrane protein [Winslowiella]|nr:YmiA family putative membrane protein [Winslowiella toletana]WNN42539.1 YmiA family putative membrane protein [Winslowiella toletana]